MPAILSGHNKNLLFKSILIGNTFPFSLIRRKVLINTVDLGEIRDELKNIKFISFWGHSETLSAVSSFLGIDITPEAIRPALTLNKDLLPTINGISFRECLVISPDYPSGFRPTPGEEVPERLIKGWSILRMIWPEEGK